MGFLVMANTLVNKQLAGCFLVMWHNNQQHWHAISSQDESNLVCLSLLVSAFRVFPSGQWMPSQEFASLGSNVLAEVPASVQDLCPNMSRFVQAIFLDPQFGSLASFAFPLYSCAIGFGAKDFLGSRSNMIKLVFPIEIVLESGLFVVLH